MVDPAKCLLQDQPRQLLLRFSCSAILVALLASIDSVPSIAAEQTASAAKAPPEVEGVLEGRLVDQQGQGVPHGEVGLVLGNSDPGQAETIVAMGIADAAGYFALPIPEKHRRGIGSLWARAEGYSPSRDNGTWSLGALDRKKDFKIVLSKSEATTFQLLDGAKNPVAGAKLTVNRVRVPNGVGYQLPTGWQEYYQAMSDAEGQVTIANMLPKAVDGAIVETANAAHLRYDLDYFLNEQPTSTAPNYTMCIPPTGTVAGRVFSDEAAAPLSNQITMTTEVRPPWGAWVGVWGEAQTTPNDEGRFEVPAIAAGYVRLAYQLDLADKWRATTGRPEKLEPEGFANVAIQVVPGVEVRGRVVKSDTGEGYPNFRLSLSYGPTEREADDRANLMQVKTDDDGWYSGVLSPGWVKLRIHSAPEDYQDMEYWRPEAESLNRTPRKIPRDTRRYEMPALELIPTRLIQGTLVDKNERPLDDWTVYGYPELEDNVMNSFAGVETDSRGAFAGRVPETVVPKLWKVYFRTRTDAYSIKDTKYTAKIISNHPLVLQVDVDGRPDAEQAPNAEQAADADNNQAD